MLTAAPGKPAGSGLQQGPRAAAHSVSRPIARYQSLMKPKPSIVMALNCYLSTFGLKPVALANCIQHAVQHVTHAPRLAPGEDWSTALITAVVTLLMAGIVALLLVSLDNARPARRRFT
jgi:hypothetical protein